MSTEAVLQCDQRTCFSYPQTVYFSCSRWIFLYAFSLMVSYEGTCGDRSEAVVVGALTVFPRTRRSLFSAITIVLQTDLSAPASSQCSHAKGQRDQPETVLKCERGAELLLTVSFQVLKCDSCSSTTWQQNVSELPQEWFAMSGLFMHVLPLCSTAPDQRKTCCALRHSWLGRSLYCCRPRHAMDNFLKQVQWSRENPWRTHRET